MRFIFTALIFGLAAFGQSQARDWGFSRDTVHEWDWKTYDESHPSHPLMDTLRILNTGSDSLLFDTSWLEIVQPDSSYFESAVVDFAASGLSGFSGFPGATWNWGSWPQYGALPWHWPYLYLNPNPNNYFAVSQVFGGLKSIDVKPAATTVIVRAIYSTQNRGQDTLFVVGDYRNEMDSLIVSIKPRMAPDYSANPKGKAERVNAQGRKSNSANSNTRPGTPLFPRDANEKGER